MSKAVLIVGSDPLQRSSVAAQLKRCAIAFVESASIADAIAAVTSAPPGTLLAIIVGREIPATDHARFAAVLEALPDRLPLRLAPISHEFGENDGEGDWHALLRTALSPTALSPTALSPTALSPNDGPKNADRLNLPGTVAFVERRRSGTGFPLRTRKGDVRRVDEVEADLIRLAVRQYAGCMSEVARKLGIGRSTLYRKMKAYGIEGR